MHFPHDSKTLDSVKQQHKNLEADVQQESPLYTV